MSNAPNGAPSRPVVEGSVQNPYREFVYNLAPQQRVPIYYDMDTFRLLDYVGDANALEVRFGATGSTTTFYQAGIGTKLPYVVDRLEIINTSANNLQIRFALAVGEIYDNRISFTNQANAIGVNTVGSKILGNSQVTVGNTAVNLSAQSSTKRSVSINAGSTPLYIGNANTVTASNGFLVPANTIFVISTEADVWAIRNTGNDTAYILNESY